MDSLKKRLTRVSYFRERSDGPNGIYWDEPCDADDDGAQPTLSNPDGPEALARIEALESQLAEKEAQTVAEIVAWLRGQADKMQADIDGISPNAVQSALRDMKHTTTAIANALEQRAYK